MTAYFCNACQHAFDAEEARCPKCLKKRTVSAEGAEPSEAERLARGESDGGTRAGVHLAMLVTSLVISMGLFGLLFLCLPALETRHAEYPAGLGLVIGSFVSLRIAPRFAVESPRPVATYLGWLGVAAGLGTSVLIAGFLAMAMAGDVSVVLTIVLAIALGLGFSVPVLGYARRLVDPEPAASRPEPPRSGKHR